jgi:hypothetical protein
MLFLVVRKAAIMTKSMRLDDSEDRVLAMSGNFTDGSDQYSPRFLYEAYTHLIVEGIQRLV